jgi:hypothetical protein
VDITPRIIKLSTNWGWVVSFTPQTIYILKLGGPRNRPVSDNERKNLCLHREASANRLDHIQCLYNLSFVGFFLFILFRNGQNIT